MGHQNTFLYSGLNHITMMLIKLGGSVVTDKSVKTTARQDVILRLAREIASVPGDKIIIHGGGSFGHIKAKEHGLHLGFNKPEQLQGVCEVQRDMRELNRLIEDALQEAGVPVASIPSGAIAVFDNGQMADFPSNVFAHYLDIGITPITFGDVVVDRSRGISICSGDDIMLRLCRDLKPEKCIFVTKVDGIFTSYPAPEGKGPIPIIKGNHDITFTVEDDDVTGSMQRKLDLMLEMTTYCNEVAVINGLVEGRVSAALNNEDYIGTRVVKG